MTQIFLDVSGEPENAVKDTKRKRQEQLREVRKRRTIIYREFLKKKQAQKSEYSP